MIQTREFTLSLYHVLLNTIQSKIVVSICIIIVYGRIYVK